MGTSTTDADFVWAVRDFTAFGIPTPDVSGDPIRVFSSSSGAGAAWCHFDALTPAIPTGATITDISMTVAVQLSSATGDAPATHQSPAISFAVESEIEMGGNPVGFGGFGAGGVGDLPMDTALHQITYVNSVYKVVGNNSGILDMDGLVAAIGAADPLGMYVTTQNVAAGQEMDFGTPWSLIVSWSQGGPTVTPPLRKHPRSDGLGTSSARRHWPPPKSVQFSNRRVGGYL